MARYARKVITSAEAWDAKVNDNELNTFDRPIPIHVHTGDQTDLESTFAAASYDQCLVWVDHTVLGHVQYFSTGTAWEIYHPKRGFRDVSGAGSINADDEVVRVAAGSTYTLTLPTATSAAGRTIVFKTISGSSTITIDGNGAETVDSSADTTLVGALATTTLYSDGTEWWIV